MCLQERNQEEKDWDGLRPNPHRGDTSAASSVGTARVGGDGQYSSINGRGPVVETIQIGSILHESLIG